MARAAYRVETPRLVLRCWEPRDAAALKAAVDQSLAHLSRMPWAAREPQTIEQKVELLRRFRGDFDLDRDYSYGIFDADERRVLGGIGLHPRGDGVRELGYWLHAAEVRRGLVTEAAAALTRLGFVHHGLHRVEIHCGPHNLASAGVARKLGFTHEATLRERFVEGDGARRDTMIFSLFAPDFPRSPAARAALRAFDAAGAELALPA